MVVDRFGRGDLTARIVFNRHDEIGNLARSFNAMAERIEVLLTAERRLLQDVSHELRSPLSRLSFAVELVRDAADPDSAMGKVRREIDRLSHLIGTLLEVNNYEWDPAARKTESVPVGSLTAEIAADCSLEAEARNVQISTGIRSTNAIEGDPELLRRAIENVLRNAIRFSPSGSDVTVEVDDVDRGIIVTVSDHGPGVPEHLLSRIFDPFFRADLSRETSLGGIGLGLSIARRAVLLHQGEITATNTLPGLRIAITVPA
jgi:two-component system sensor histidine kinase CpxA